LASALDSAAGRLGDSATRRLSGSATGRLRDSASAFAERALRIDPSSPLLRDVSAQLAGAAAAMSGRREDEAAVAIEQASRGIVKILRRELPEAPAQAAEFRERRMQGALVDALRAGRP
jgi:hypothetical protein